MKICARCVLPETFPGVRFDAEGVCSYCRGHKGEDKLAAKMERARKKFETLVDEVRGRSGYHCLLAFSGGKDSTYTLWLLRELYDLRVLAVTVDNGFLSPESFSNIRRVVENVNADHILIKPRFDLLKKMFAAVLEKSPFPMKALERASSICNVCMGLVKSITLRIALEQSVPIVAYGWSPGQAPISASIFRLNALMVRQMQGARMAPLAAIAGDALSPYVLSERHLGIRDKFPHSVNPLAFLKYDEQVILEQIERLGWLPPDDTDGNSSNCLLNSLANRLHIEKHGFHPYAFEVAGLIREGVMDRKEGLAKLGDLGSTEVAVAVAKRLGLEVSETELRG